RWAWAVALCGATPVLLAAQDAGTLRGRVVDEQRLPVAAAQVSIRPLAGDGAAVTVETTDDGTFSRGSIPSGLYTVTAGKDDLRGDMFRVRIRAGRTVRVNVELAAGRRDAAWIAELGDREAASRAFAAGVLASRAANHATAVEQFLRAITRTPDCAACHYNLAIAYSELDRFADAETAFRQVVELTPDYSAAYYGLASIYTRQGRADDARTARDEATRLARERLADRSRRLEETLQQSVARLDAGDTAGALAALEMLLKRDSSFAPTRYWLGVALLGIDAPDRAATQFQRYLELDGDGEYAEHARAALADLNR
ncbi:MAG: tetratricopeptide repeat protein, partial [Acidobacteria bacterium]|nr:tetratricopeptide repeat protein [Acidobacteriota bacterium]